MPGKIVIIGAGFAGVWSALSAQRLINLNKKTDAIEVIVIAPEPSLIIRPRLYEANVAGMTHPLGELFKAAGVRFIQGIAHGIQPDAHTVQVRSAAGTESTISFDRLILAAGSSVIRPKAIAGIDEHAFDIDTLEAAVKLEAHIMSLPSLPAAPGRETIVVCGSGFTGIEIATELPKRIGHLHDPQIIIVDRAEEAGASLGPGPRPIITQALNELGIQVKLGSGVSSIDSEGLTLASGERIQSKTVIWTAGVRATPLTQKIPGSRDELDRLHVDKYLQAPSADHILATGDAACALADEDGHYVMMSCQHGLSLGRISGHNAAAQLLGEPMEEYSQLEYGCCLDLGAWGTVVSEGWERKVKITGDLAKKVKYNINQKLIYPPTDVNEALEIAKPHSVANTRELFERIVQEVS